jgi:hypothetical protein
MSIYKIEIVPNPENPNYAEVYSVEARSWEEASAIVSKKIADDKREALEPAGYGADGELHW